MMIFCPHSVSIILDWKANLILHKAVRELPGGLRGTHSGLTVNNLCE